MQEENNRAQVYVCESEEEALKTTKKCRAEICHEECISRDELDDELPMIKVGNAYIINFAGDFHICMWEDMFSPSMCGGERQATMKEIEDDARTFRCESESEAKESAEYGKIDLLNNKATIILDKTVDMGKVGNSYIINYSGEFFIFYWEDFEN